MPSFRGRTAATEGDAVGVERSVGRERCVPPLSPLLGPESALAAPTVLPDLAVGAGRGVDFTLPDFVAPHPDKAMTAAKTTPAVMCNRLITSLFRRTEPQDRFQDGCADQRVQRLPAGGDPEPAAVRRQRDHHGLGRSVHTSAGKGPRRGGTDSALGVCPARPFRRSRWPYSSKSTSHGHRPHAAFLQHAQKCAFGMSPADGTQLRQGHEGERDRAPRPLASRKSSSVPGPGLVRGGPPTAEAGTDRTCWATGASHR